MKDLQQPKLIRHRSRQSKKTEDEPSFSFLDNSTFSHFQSFGKTTEFSHFHRTYNEKMTENQIHMCNNNLHKLLKTETLWLRTSTKLKAQCEDASESKEV